MAGKTNTLVSFNPREDHRRSDANRSNARTDVVTGTLQGFNSQGAPLVTCPQSSGALAARTIVETGEQDCGRSVLLMFANGDRSQPVIMGFLKQPHPNAARLNLKKTDLDRVVVDGVAVDIRADKEIVIQCGQASITLKKNGKVIIKGTKIVSHAKGVNKVKGAAVSIN
jgi:hypothetical protein